VIYEMTIRPSRIGGRRAPGLYRPPARRRCSGGDRRHVAAAAAPPFLG
jgi:hypothetical protein